MVNSESLLVLVFVLFFLERVRWALILLIVTQFGAYLVEGLNVGSVFGHLPPIVTVLCLFGLLACKLHRRSRIGGVPAIPWQMTLVVVYLVVTGLLGSIAPSGLQYDALLPVVLALTVTLLVIYVEWPDEFERVVSGGLMIAFVMLLIGFLLELVMNRNLALILGAEPTALRLHGGYDRRGFVLQGLLGNSNESAGALVTVLPIFWIF